MKHTARGIMHLFPACMWIFALVGIVIAAHERGNVQIVSSGATLLILFSIAVLVGAYAIGYLLREEAKNPLAGAEVGGDG